MNHTKKREKSGYCGQQETLQNQSVLRGKQPQRAMSGLHTHSMQNLCVCKCTYRSALKKVDSWQAIMLYKAIKIVACHEVKAAGSGK